MPVATSYFIPTGMLTVVFNCDEDGNERYSVVQTNMAGQFVDVLCTVNDLELAHATAQDMRLNW